MKRAQTFPAMQRQHGFNLIEMMISLAIGLVIILFVSSLYVASRGSYQLNDDNSRLQEDGRVVMALIGRNLTQAGYGQPDHFEGGALVTTLGNGQPFQACDNGFTTNNTATSVCATGAAGVTAFQVSYQVDKVVNVNIGAGTDCNGQTVAPDANGNRIAINRFYLSTPDGESTQSLYCVGNGNPISQPLLGNVEVLRLTYGMDLDRNHTPDGFYATAASALAAEDLATPKYSRPFGGLVSVAVCLQLSSANNVATAAQTFRGCSGELKTATDRKLHAVLRGVFTIRNNAGTTLVQYPNYP
jgi:type IV pilus assembly protein PilW